MRTIDEIFNDRTCNNFSDKQVSDELLNSIYDIVKLGPTSANCCPLRIIFVKSPSEKERLASLSMEGNANKIRAASVTAIFAYDLKFYTKMDYLFSHDASMKQFFESSEQIALDSARRSAVLQAAYFMMVARGAGLAVGPMSGFDNEAVDKEFLAGTNFKSDFICSLGYASGPESHQKLPRLKFAEVCKIV